eukprot:jgi/Astpho2/9033/fgenesh1_pm.00133_%23_32_t
MPHPNHGCILVDPAGRRIAEAFQYAQGTQSAEVLAVAQAAGSAQEATAYLNMETGDCHGDASSTAALVAAGVRRVVVGMRHPLPHFRGQALQAYSAAGLAVEDSNLTVALSAHATPCDFVLQALLHRAVTGKPLGVFKYAMTLDGKIATSSGHSAWVSSSTSRQQVFETRARSDAVVVGGETVRRDNPRLTTRREGGHMPMRIVMSRTLDLPQDANLWDTSIAPTAVMTQLGARTAFQRQLQDRGVEVVQFDFLTPEGVAAYCHERGFLQCLWECGGMLAAPAISGGALHKALAFIAPKLVGGVRAPSPVGELGNVEMTQALQLVDVQWQPSGPDILMTGYLPSSGGLMALHTALAAAEGNALTGSRQSDAAEGLGQTPSTAAEFYKTWERYGSLSNFSPHPIWMPEEPGRHGQGRWWPTLEHYYQAQKFNWDCRRGLQDLRQAAAIQSDIAAAASPEEAARIGRRAQRTFPHLARPDWRTPGVGGAVMRAALTVKFHLHEGPRQMLLSTAPDQLVVESSPNDFYWGRGIDGTGSNLLGKLLMRVRSELQQAEKLLSTVTTNGTAAQPQRLQESDVITF